MQKNVSEKERQLQKQVLDKGEVRLIDYMGGDLSVVRAARVSTGATPEDASKGEESDKKLIRFLMKNKHTSPFEHVIFTFYVKAPFFVVREWHRHRTWSYNEISGRYAELKNEFYIPTEYRAQAKSNKQSSYFPEESPIDVSLQNWNEGVWVTINKASENSYRTYKNLLDWGVAREMARMVLPLNMYTEFYATVDAHNLMHFLNLRTAENAQYEIRQYANAIEEMFKEVMPWTYEAWKSNE